MDKKIEEAMKKRLKEGWIKSNFMVEAMGLTKEVTEAALKKHVGMMDKEKDVIIAYKEFGTVNEIEKPLPNVPKGYSQVVEIEFIVESFDKLVQLVLTYGPASIEVLEPEKLTVGMGEAQMIINTIATLIHRFAASGKGAMLVNP